MSFRETGRQARLESEVAELTRRLTEAWDRVKAVAQRPGDQPMAPLSTRLQRVENGLATAVTGLKELAYLAEPPIQNRLPRLCAALPDLSQLLYRKGGELAKPRAPGARATRPGHLDAA